jgi:signal transduction histidine kinase
MDLAKAGRAIAIYLWEGPPELQGPLRLEWRFVGIRWLGIAFMSPGLLLAHLPSAQLREAYAVLAVAALYNLIVQKLLLTRPSLLTTGYLTMIGDSLLNVAMVTVGGGFNSPFYYILYTVTISAAMRYGYAQALGMALLYTIFDVIETTSGGKGVSAPLVFRSGFLFITAILAGYLREQAQRAEAALHQRLREATQLNAALAQAHEELLRVDQAKTNFLANVSHEIRTPLSSIRSFSELLLSYEEDPAVQREFLGIINSESERLTRLLNDVLDIAKIESGRMEWHMAIVDLAELIRDSARTYVAAMEQQDLAFEQDVDPQLPPIFGDRDRLQQVLGNLLNNALKFTSRGAIRLSAHRTGDEVRIAVSDTGIGIAPENHDRIFEKFQQVGEVLTDKPKGTGLGLSICREIVEHHQGRIWVESELGHGSTFVVVLPLAPAEESEPVPSAGPVLSAARA